MGFLKPFVLWLRRLVVQHFNKSFCQQIAHEVVTFFEKMKVVAAHVLGCQPFACSAFAAAMAPILRLGVQYAGGCCGTDPDYIRQLARLAE